jgi:hypothetical protein
MSRSLATLAALALSIACAKAGPVPTEAAQQPPKTPPAAPTATPGANSDAQTVASFQARLKEYSELHNKLEKTLPPLPKETNPTVIDKHQRALEAQLKEARKTAKPGDIFTPEGTQLVRRVLAQIFRGAEGAKLKDTINDENPSTVKLAVNSRYPDEVPLSTMPPQVLAMLPKLPEELEYRFIGNRLILLDVHAHTIADYIENVLPA